MHHPRYTLALQLKLPRSIFLHGLRSLAAQIVPTYSFPATYVGTYPSTVQNTVTRGFVFGYNAY